MQLSSLRTRLVALFAMLTLIVTAVSVLALRQLQAISASLDTVYRDRVVCLQQLHVVGSAYSRGVAGAVAQVRDGAMTSEQAMLVVDRDDSAALRQWDAYRRTTLTPPEARLIAAAQPVLARAHGVALAIRSLLRANDTRGLAAIAGHDMPAAFDALSAATDDLMNLQTTVSREENRRSQQDYRDACLAIAGLVAATLVLGGGLTWSVVARYAGEMRAQAARVERINNYYQALSQTNQLIVRESDVNRLLAELCRICVECGQARMACVTLLDGGKASRIVENGPAVPFFDGIARDWDPDAPALRPSLTATALREGRHAISNDYQHQAPHESWRARAVETGIRSAAAFPFMRGRRVAGALTLYAPDLDYFDEGPVRLLDEMAGDVSFALDNIDREAARNAAQAQMQASLERFQQVFQLAPVSTVIATLEDNRVLEVNDVFCARYGFEREEVIGRRLWDLGVGLVDDDVEAYRDRLQREPGIHNMEVRTRVRSGEIITLLISSERIDYGGEPCVLSMSLDVTELRQAERARESQVAAEAASHAKTAFLARMSHELRTPLNAVLGFAQLMRHECGQALAPKDLDRLAHIEKSGWHLLSLVNDVLDVSRIESGKLGLDMRDIALAPVLDEVVQISGPQAAGAGVLVTIDEVAADAAGVHADPVRLRQVAINLVSNAIKYNRRGGTVRLSARAISGRVSVEVVDSGIGMTPDQLAHLYEPFNRLGHERGGIEGTGLGLALTRQLVMQMGGELVIESRLGEGTCARLTLPGAEVHAGGAEPDRLGEASNAGEEPSGVVLYIEDNDINAMLVEQMLSRLHAVRVIHAPDGRSGIEQARRALPDLVLLDMQLPDVDGVDVLDALRADEATRSLRVVALSASAMPEDIELARRHGALDYWTKPLDVDRFLRDMTTMLGRQEAAS